MKKLQFKNLEIFTRNGFSVVKDKKYPIVEHTGDIYFCEDENNTRIGISEMADQAVILILDDNDNIINKPFVEVTPEEYRILRDRQ
jgi:hypothetical protein